ncbi:uncharacterized protein LOC125356806 [Perognathus longimembris pacificus]|uniref:uncharacterized protein LOC125356806 n=1 Tax=Perognathus longimembris pacificus TaxID=214514 RepID=UPI002019CB91|nr:uncharacterized protein LOC125356806 [Perognathus longimembris pacificus]
MESFCLDDIGSVIQNKAMERIVSPMTTQLCHLLISMERKVISNDAFASLEMTAAELRKATEDLAQVAPRLAGDSEERFREQVKPVAESLIRSGRNITQVAQRLHLHPESRWHRAELVATAQQILVGTTKVRSRRSRRAGCVLAPKSQTQPAQMLLLEDAETARDPRASLTAAQQVILPAQPVREGPDGTPHRPDLRSPPRGPARGPPAAPEGAPREVPAPRQGPPTGASGGCVPPGAGQRGDGARGAPPGLAAAAGPWYPLCRQLFGHHAAADLAGSVAVFAELRGKLGALVRLAAEPGPAGPDGALSRVRGRWEEAEIHAEHLLRRLAVRPGPRAPGAWDPGVENGCLLWSLAVQDLLERLKRLSGRQGLFLRPLRRAVERGRGWQGGVAQAVDAVERLRGAARLSRRLCADAQVRGEVSVLGGEVRLLADALAGVARALAAAPGPSPSLGARFELLCLELALRARALGSRLGGINAPYERAFHRAVRPALSAGTHPPPAATRFLEDVASAIRDAQGLLGREPGHCPEDLAAALESLRGVTHEAARRLPGLRGHPEEWARQALDWLRWEWAAKAHHAVRQLQAWPGGHAPAWRLLAQRLQPGDEAAGASQQDLVRAQLRGRERSPGATAGDGGASPDAVRRGTPGSSADTGTAEPAVIARTVTTGDAGTQQNDSPCPSPGCPDRLRVEKDQPLREDENAITQLTQEMAKEVLLMDMSLKKRGRVLTKDQLITSARKIATSGQNLSRLIRIIAKNCIDQRCSQELLCVVEQIQTMSNQLRIISSVKASLERSRSSEELLVENARQLLQAVSKAVRAAEAASVRGLKTPSLDPEELEVAALCTQWRRKLVRYRRQEISNVDCDELGLRKTSTKTPPALVAGSKGIIKTKAGCCELTPVNPSY